MALAQQGRLEEVVANAQRLAAAGKGLLASDESVSTVGKRLQAVGLENTESVRRAYRELLYTARNVGQYLSGVIMFEETLYQATSEGVPFVEVLKKEGILAGVKVDKGLVALAGTDGESTTAGLDGLGTRCDAYYKQGARFAKWRSTIKISDTLPNPSTVRLNAEGLAQYAATCQQHGLVPIVEPEILIDGHHKLERSAQVAEGVLAAVIYALQQQCVCLEGILLKPQMVLPGFDCPTRASKEEIAEATLRALQRTIPGAVPGVMFLSGGQSEEEATEHLNVLNLMKAKAGDRAPWALSFSFGRALQASVLRIWAGNDNNREEAQRVGSELARVNAAAAVGQYKGPHPSTCVDDLREGFRGWRG